MRTTKIGPYLRLPSMQITVLTFLVKKKSKMKLSGVSFFLKTRKNLSEISHSYSFLSPDLKVMLHGTIRNDDF